MCGISVYSLDSHFPLGLDDTDSGIGDELWTGLSTVELYHQLRHTHHKRLGTQGFQWQAQASSMVSARDSVQAQAPSVLSVLGAP